MAITANMYADISFADMQTGMNGFYSNYRPNIGNFDLNQNTKSPWLSQKQNWKTGKTVR